MWLTLVALNAAVVDGGWAAGSARTPIALSTEDVRLRETAGGDLVADAILKAGMADVALVNGALFRPDTVGPGKVTAAQVSALLADPDRKWVVSNISGNSLQLALERSLSRAGEVAEPSANFLQVAGIRVEYDPKATAGDRVTSLAIGRKPQQADSKYRVAMPEDLAKGGSGYFTVPEFNDTTILPETTGTLAEAINQLLEQTAELEYSDEKPERIVPLNR